MNTTKPTTNPTMKTNETNTPETLAAILAEFRQFALRAAQWDKTISPESILLLADKVEAAAERERNAHTNDIHDALYLATGIPGNAAAMREALEKIRHEYGWGRIGCRTCVSSEADVERVSDLFEKQIDAALAAPARNCDRFADELDAQLAFLNDVWLISVDKNTMLEKDKFENWTEQMKTRYGRWLFATAEGGDHA